MINTVSIIPIVSASITGIIGLYFIFIYIFNRRQLILLAFGVTAISVCVYSIGTFGLYNSTYIDTTVNWLRIQISGSTLFIVAYYSFISIFLNNKVSKEKSLSIFLFGLIAILFQWLIRSSLTWNIDNYESLLYYFFGKPFIFFKITPGFFTLVTFIFIGVIYLFILKNILVAKKGKSKKKTHPIFFVTLFIFLAYVNDSLISFGVYQFMYFLEISFLLLILHFSSMLAGDVIESVGNKESLENANKELESHRLELEKLVSEQTKEFQYQAEYFRSLVENSPIAIVTIDNQQRVTNCNSAFETLFGYTLQEALNQDLDYLITSQEVYQDALNLTKSVLNWEKISSTGLRKRKDGTMVSVQISGVPVIVNGEKLGVLGLYQDVTDRNKAEQILRESEARYRSLFEDSPISLWEEDFSQVKLEIDKLRTSGIDNFNEYFTSHPDFVKYLMQQIKIININLATVNLFKTETKEKFLTGLDVFIPDDSISVITKEFISLAEGNTSFFSEIDHINFDGQVIHTVLRLSIAPGYEQNWGKVFVSIIDNTERKIYEQNLKFLSSHDQLTGLANRSLLFELLNHAISNAKRLEKKLAVLFIDLDGFKAINDQFGHAVGDKFLIITAQRLRTSLRESDTIARIGGDEFLIILENLDNISDVEPIAEKLLTTISVPYKFNGNSCQVTTSIGISIYPDAGSDPEHLINLADNVMYLAKQKGKNQYQVTETL